MPDIFTTQNKKQLENKAIPINSLGIFTTFCKSPGGVSFANQDPQEVIMLFLRRDFITNVPWIAATIILLLIPFLFSFILQTVNFPLPVFSPNFIMLFNIFYFLIVLGFAFSNFITWFYTIGLVTNKRAVDIDFVDVSSINFAAADLKDIVDAKYSQNGFFQSFFDFGDVHLIVEAAKQEFLFDRSPRPSEISKIINDLIGSN